MKKIVGILLIFCSSVLLSSFISSEFISDRKNDNQDYELMVGEFDLEELKSTKNKEWFSFGYKNYLPKPEVIKEMTSVIEKKDFHISVYMGTWCPDSRREFPRLIKILDDTEFDLEKLTIVGVGRDKIVTNASKEERKKLNILNVPTLIVYDKMGKEINRFVEFPQETLEEDLLKIFSGQDYKHVYDF